MKASVSKCTKQLHFLVVSMPVNFLVIFVVENKNIDTSVVCDIMNPRKAAD